MTNNYINLNNPGNYQGINQVLHASTDASIDIATLGNSCSNKIEKIDSVIVLRPYDLSFVDFMSCFYYQPGGAFSVNPLNYSFRPMLLTCQTYETTDNKQFNWNLYNQCLKTYCEKHSISENVISPFKKIELTKETFRHQSLATNSGTQVALNWDMILDNLQVTNQIKNTKDPDHNASINFKVHYVYHSTVLDVTVQSTFTYRCSIPGYRNVYNNEFNPTISNLSPYSKNQTNDDLVVPIVPLTPALQKNKQQKVQNKKEKKIISYYESPNNINNDVDLNINEYINDTETVLTNNILSALHNNDDETQIYEEDENHIYGEDEEDNISFSVEPTNLKVW